MESEIERLVKEGILSPIRIPTNNERTLLFSSFKKRSRVSSTSDLPALKAPRLGAEKLKSKSEAKAPLKLN